MIFHLLIFLLRLGDLFMISMRMQSSTPAMLISSCRTYMD
ncbi:hypothetical protein Goari_027444 [Gossypium aridum]|uniref:Uncharacterized protein n=1 Tax=Gossypium aridum TaxID=34290 RepID=A0A7J8YMB2_GOSAI|nr:hypothetical protein [Gossypium aridum]